MKRKPDARAPLPLTADGREAVRSALASPPRHRLSLRWVLLCAALMTAAALALCAVVLASGQPQADPPSAEWRGVLAR